MGPLADMLAGPPQGLSWHIMSQDTAGPRYPVTGKESRHTQVRPVVVLQEEGLIPFHLIALLQLIIKQSSLLHVKICILRKCLTKMSLLDTREQAKGSSRINFLMIYTCL